METEGAMDDGRRRSRRKQGSLTSVFPFSLQNKVLTIDGVKVKLQVSNAAPIKGSCRNL